MLEAVAKIIRQTPIDEYSHGIAAKFYRIDEKWGLKFFINEEHARDKTYELQQLASQYGLAPQIGSKFDMDLPDGRRAYGYITETLPKTMRDVFLEKHGYTNHTTLYKEDQRLYWKGSGEWDDTGFSQDLHKDLKYIGIESWDLHWGNVGYLNGRLVSIDFSEDNLTDHS